MLSWPNRITLARLLLVPVFVLLLLNAAGNPDYRYAALGLAVLIGIADAADGIVARRTGKVTKIGSVLDPLADKALMISALVLLSSARVMPDLQARLPYWVSVTLVSRDVFMLVGAAVLFLLAGMFQALSSASGKAVTVMQFLMIAATIASPDLLGWWPVGAWWALHVIWAVTVALGVISWLGYIRMGLKLIVSVGNPD